MTLHSAFGQAFGSNKESLDSVTHPIKRHKGVDYNKDIMQQSWFINFVFLNIARPRIEPSMIQEKRSWLSP